VDVIYIKEAGKGARIRGMAGEWEERKGGNGRGRGEIIEKYINQNNNALIFILD
jgi:hypothetical protein